MALLSTHSRDVADAVTGDSRIDESHSTRKAARRKKFIRTFDRPGMPWRGPAWPTAAAHHIPATMLVAVGVCTTRVLAWQIVAIVGWITMVAFSSAECWGS